MTYKQKGKFITNGSDLPKLIKKTDKKNLWNCTTSDEENSKTKESKLKVQSN